MKLYPNIVLLVSVLILIRFYDHGRVYISVLAISAWITICYPKKQKNTNNECKKKFNDCMKVHIILKHKL